MNLEQRIKSLPPDKRAQLEKKLKQKLRENKRLVAVNRDGGKDAFPLSFAQQRLWFLYQLDPESPFYNIPTSLRLSGELDIQALKLSINDIVKRHEALRTTFLSRGEGAVQKIHPDVSIDLPIEDLVQLEDKALETAIKQLSNEEARKPFDLAQLPLLRCKLLKLKDTEHILIINIHHIVSDGWSMSVFNKELKAFYAHNTANAPVMLDDLPVQYCDYSVWQRDWMSGEVLDEQLGYWKTKLKDAPPLLEMPLDRAYPPVKSYCGKHIRCMLSQDLTESLKQQAKQTHATLFMYLLAAFGLLLSRYTRQQDIVIGSPIAGRQQQETENLIGFFINTLALRTDLSGAPTFRELLGRVRETTLGAYAHQDLPFEKIVEELKPERSLGYSPLFQVMFALQTASTETMQLQGIDIRAAEIDSGVEKFDLTVSATERPEGLRIFWSYNTDIYNQDTIERMTRHYQALLEQVVADPDKPVSDYELLTPEERRQLLFDWNATAADYPHDQCVHALFEARVEQNPAAVAVIHEGQSLSYADLNARANRVAHYLIEQGVEADTLVALCLERSLDLVVAVLGILKAGGTYVPLDPGYPQERLAFMLEDTRAPVLITQSALQAVLPPHEAIGLCLDSADDLLAGYADENPAVRTESHHLAYVIYTSGSTGQPKGVEISHRSLINLVTWHQRTYGLTPEDRTTLLAGPAFDASVWEIWPTLTAGASLHIPDETVRMAPDRLIQWYADQGISVSFLPTPLATALLEQNVPARLTLRTLLTGGEALRLPSLKALPFNLVNHYGPTENTVVTTSATVFPEQSTHNPPIGRPISNTQVYILDAHLKPVPIGVVGELYTGGDGLARGYLNRPDLTAERFIPNPLAGTPGERLYRTGDLVRYRTDGNIEFTGRSDDQVKIRGFRIELGEIEATLSQYPQVQDCLVMVREEGAGGKRLVACVVSGQAAEDFSFVLQDYLRETLPEYMVPSAFIMLDAFPLTPNGKVDKKALAAMDLVQSPETAYVSPRTPVEQELATIWCDLLQIDRVGIHDNFFQLGGHSLLATQAISRIQSILQVGLPLRALFESPTIAALSLLISGMQTEGGSGVEQRIVPLVDRDSAELSFAQQRLWFLYRLDPDSPFYNISAAWRLRGQLDVGVLGSALNIIIQRHEALRTTFSMRQGEPVQLISPSMTVPLPVIDLRNFPETERESEVNRRLTEEARQTFDMEKGPLLSVKLLHLEKQEHVFLLIIHHIVSDGWSMGVFMRELSALYQALAAGHPDPLPALPVQYADFAVWQRGWLQGDVLDNQLQYWKERLTGAATLELPTDRPRPAVQTLAGNYLSFRFAEPLTSALKKLGYSEGATLFMILLAAFQVLLHRYTRQPDIVVGSPIAGRQQQETEGLIGFFVNTLALRADLSGDPTFRGLLEQVRETTLGAYAYQDLPFEKLVEELQPERNLSHSPVFQVMFALQNIPPRDLKLADLTINSMAARSNTAKYELSLFMVEDGKELTGLFEYNTDLFDEATIRRMADHYQTLLEDIVSRPDQRISTYALLTGTERQQLLVDWNATTTDYPRDPCIHQLFEAQVARTPGAVAVAYEDQQLSYAELNARANQLAHYLRTRGVGPDVPVAICVERSLEMVIGVLGILKAGGAYVPLDPHYPKDRLTFMLEDTRAPVLVTRTALAGLLPHGEAEVLCLDGDRERIARESDTDPVNQTTADNLLYVIYTSGSTGKPKGVSLSHRALCNLVMWQTSQQNFMQGARTLQFTSLSFDVSFQEIFTTWCSGGTLVMIAPETRSDFRRLATFILENGIERLFLPFVALHNLAELMDRGQGTGSKLREIITAGEQLRITPAIIELFEGLDNCALHNHYGPTEAHVVTACTLSGDPHSWPELPPIGRPIANTQMYILDAHSCPVPAGVAGELIIGGTCLARGYLNRPELTVEKFIPDPFSNDADARLYKTGDLARYLPDGNIEFLGRIDHQVKIRGFRIELGEIESVLGRNSRVRQAVVVAREDAPGEKRLVAYIVPVQGQALTTGDLRDYLKEKVPDYMIPSAFVILDALPLTPTGKVDRKALPAPDCQKTDRDEGVVGPRNVTEETLASIWCNLLGLDTVGVYDNFFELGGHSLLSVRLLDRIEKTFGRKLPLAALFQAPTIDALARSLNDEKPDVTWSTLMAIQPSGSRPPLFFVSGSTFKQTISRHLGPDQPFFGFEDFGVDGKRATYIKVEDLAAFYIKELRAFRKNGPYFLAGFCFGGLVAFEMARQLTEQGEQIALLALIDAVNPVCPGPKVEVSAGEVEVPVSRHKRYYNRLVSIPHREKPVFLTRSLFRKIKGLLYFDKEKLVIHVQKLICRMYLCFDIPIPVSLRDFYIVENYIEAIHDFKPAKYKGRIVLFKSEVHAERDPELGWGNVAEGGVKIHDIAGTHMSMIDNEENVRILAELLGAEIEQAQVDERQPKRTRASN